MKHMIDDENTYQIDTRTDNPYQVGIELMEMAGVRFGPSTENAAEVAAYLESVGVILVDFDGEALNMARYIDRAMNN